MEDQRSARKRAQFTLQALVATVMIAALSFGLVRWKGPIVIPLILFPSGTAAGVAVVRILGRDQSLAVRLGGAFGGCLGLAIAAFIWGMLPPPPGTVYKWFGQGSLASASAFALIYGPCGFVGGLIVGEIAARMFRIASQQATHSRLETPLILMAVFLLALGMLLIFCGL